MLAKVPAARSRARSRTSSGAAASRPAKPGTNVGRVAAILAGVDVPGVTVNRYCSSSLQTIRMAAHAIKAGEGDVFVAGGVETVSRFAYGAADSGAPNEKFREARARTKERTEGGKPSGRRRPGLPDVYIAMGQTAENVVEAEGVTREEMDEFGARSQQRAVAHAGERLLRARDHAGDARPTARS